MRRVWNRARYSRAEMRHNSTHSHRAHRQILYERHRKHNK